MKKIITIKEAVKVSKHLRQQGKKIVLVGGCFDLLHIGHVEFLKHAKKKGQILFVLIESDNNIRKSKGENRPIHTQNQRAEIVSVIEPVDYVVKLAYLSTDNDYDNVVISLKPDIIATTQGDPYRKHKERQAERIHASVVDVIKPISGKSSTMLTKILSEV